MDITDKKLAAALKGASSRVITTACIMERLIVVMTEENKLVQTHKVEACRALLKEKQLLATSYSTNLETLKAQPELLKSLSEDGRAALKDLSRRLAAASEGNATMLRGAIAAVRQLVANIMSMIKSSVAAPSTYRNTAKHYIQPGAYSPTCQPIAVSRSV